VKPPQRIMTAGGLGEMGNALPGAIGASFARGKGEVLAFIGDGGMMMNLQELAVVKHHNLPVKMLVFENDGYSMIKGTFANVGKPRRGVDKASGLEMPDFCEWRRHSTSRRTHQDMGRLRPRDPEDARASRAVSRLRCISTRSRHSCRG
jgi:thiamine pyrophosphate-dependent acetolactate synthase large subunit-like protein